MHHRPGRGFAADGLQRVESPVGRVVRRAAQQRQQGLHGAQARLADSGDQIWRAIRRHEEQDDDDRAKNDPDFAGKPVADKLRRMLEILETDTAYPQEYDRFVKSVSYAKDGEAPDFASAVQALRALVHAVTS